MSTRQTAAAAVGMLALAAAGCGASRHGSAGRPSAVAIQSFAYRPTPVTVSPGTRLTFDNRDSVEHTASADDGTAFDSGPIQAHHSAVITLSKAGTFAYHCDFHPFMRGTIIVR